MPRASRSSASAWTKTEQKLASFAKEKKMTWPQYFDGLGWENKLAVKYGVQSIPATYLLDGKGIIIGKDLRGEALDAAVAKALARQVDRAQTARLATVCLTIAGNALF